MLHAFSILIGIAVLVVGYLFLRAYTNIHLSEVLIKWFFDLFGFSTKWLQDAAQDRATKNKLRFSRENKAQREKDKLYKYYRFVEDILASLNLREHGITVEGLTIVCGFASVLVSILSGLVLQNLFMCLIVFGVVYTAILAILYLVSRMGAMERKKHMLAAIDLLCSNMSNGIVKAVQDNIMLINPSIRPVFNKFLRNVLSLNLSLDEALVILNNDLGTTFDYFIETVALYEKDRAPGMDVLFSFIVMDNAKESLRDVKIKRAADKILLDFLASCGVLFSMLVLTFISFDYVTEFYTTSFGQIILIGYVLSALIVFIITQVIIGRAYIYKEKS